MVEVDILNEVVIRRPNIEDVKQFHEFVQTVLVDTYERNGFIDWNDLLADEIKCKQKYLQQDFDTNGMDRFFLIAEYKNEIIGSIEYGLVDDLVKKCTNNELDGFLEIGTVFVHPSYQAKGLSSLLYYGILKEMKNKEESEACLDSGYKTAQKIWSSRFGKPNYHLKDFWASGSDHMIWRISVEKELEQCRIVLGLTL